MKYVNHEAEDDAAIVNDDPYGEGWLVKIDLDAYSVMPRTAGSFVSSTHTWSSEYCRCLPVWRRLARQDRP